ncbi:MAG: curli assembly protein CsgG [Aquificae bacterium]|nr:curli assembly protein CsgG [Aquificota bacterium]
MRGLLALLALISLAYAVPKYLEDCLESALDLKKALEKAEPYTGKVYKAYLSKRKKTGECLYKIKGVKGTAVLDATTGELVNFFKRR